MRRFSITCYGHQESVEEMRAHKSEKFKELSSKRGTKEYDEWFLNYRPDQKNKWVKNISHTNTINNMNNNNNNNMNNNNNNINNNNNNITDQMNMKPKKTKTNPKKKKTNKTKTKPKKTFFDIYGRKTRKNKKGAIY